MSANLRSIHRVSPSRPRRARLWALRLAALAAASALASPTAWAQPAGAAPSATGEGPLTEQARAIFFGTPEDPDPVVLDATRDDLEGRHYLYSDERNPHLFFEHIEGLGGGYVGVGSDQAYLFAGIMRPELVWLADYDPWIKALHLAYFAFFEHADTPEAFMALWDHDNEESSRALLEAAYADHPDLDLIIEVHDQATRLVHRRLRHVRRLMSEHGYPSFVSDSSTYQYVRELIAQGRFRPMVGNLLGEQGYVGIGHAARELGVTIRVIYLSNAESYWDYTEAFRQNMLALPTDERSVVLRTRASKPQNGDYCYAVQSATAFQAQVDNPDVRRLRHVWRTESIDGPDHIPFRVILEGDFEGDFEGDGSDETGETASE